MVGDYRVIRLRPTDVLVLRVPQQLTPGALDKTLDAMEKKVEAAGLECADIWVVDGGAEIEVLAMEDVEDER